MQGIRVCGREADRLRSKGYGRNDGRCIVLSYEEAVYLAEQGTAGLNFEKVFREAISIPGFDTRFFVYRDLRSRGYVLSVREDCFFGKKSFGMCFYPHSDEEWVSFEMLVARELPHIMAVVDGDGDVTYYMVERAEPEGECHERPGVEDVIMGEKRVFSLGRGDTGTFGRNEGRFRHFSMNEYYYLTGTRSENEIYAVYEDLRSRGLIVKSGFKYGTHFRVYERSMEEHARYLVHVLSEESMLQVSRAIRVAHGVRKTLLLAKKCGSEVKYIAISWLRP
ncbi:MAG: tRNA-intron lyase [Euryarchaeota archaeon]|nr:tRNA-intron lyase [Euryarchaeota archaeon]